MFKLIQRMMEEERRHRESGREAPKADLESLAKAYQDAPAEERELLHDGITEIISLFVSDKDVDAMARKKQRQETLKELLFSDSPSANTKEPGEIEKAKRRAEKLAKLPELETQLRGLGVSEIEIGKILERARIEIMDSE